MPRLLNISDAGFEAYVVLNQAADQQDPQADKPKDYGSSEWP